MSKNTYTFRGVEFKIWRWISEDGKEKMWYYLIGESDPIDDIYLFKRTAIQAAKETIAQKKRQA
jgi:hypothetical protein